MKKLPKNLIKRIGLGLKDLLPIASTLSENKRSEHGGEGKVGRWRLGTVIAVLVVILEILYTYYYG